MCLLGVALKGGSGIFWFESFQSYSKLKLLRPKLLRGDPPSHTVYLHPEIQIYEMLQLNVKCLVCDCVHVLLNLFVLLNQFT